jgi:hypothetical protein
MRHWQCFCYGGRGQVQSWWFQNPWNCIY